MNIIITGFMGTGKTTIGRLLASKMGRLHLDTDELIEHKTGQRINNLFEKYGESYFRQLEKSVVKDLVRNQTEAVISTGGKTLLDEENFARLSLTGPVLTLIDDPLNCWKRVSGQSFRPLIKNLDQTGFLNLFRQREKAYKNLPNKINITGLSAEDAVEKILSFLNFSSYRFELEGGKQKASVIIKRFTDFAPQELAEDRNLRLFMVYDQKIAENWKTITLDERVACLPLKATDINKNLRQAEKIWKWLLEHGVKRDSVLISLGGGVVGDLAGFVSSTMLRGIRHVHLPTTLLAMADSCLGGKTGINYGQFKNALGTFSLPEQVIINPFFLTSLSQRDLSAGLVEAIKAGLLADAGLLSVIESNVELILRKDVFLLEEVIWRALQVKKAVVEEDLYEKGVRKKLNLGHTLAHALEAYLGYRISHGAAVAVGLIYSLRVSELLGLTDSDIRERMKNLFLRLGLKTRVKGKKTEIMNLMEKDKKNTERGLDFILLSDRSGVCIRNNIEKTILLAAMEDVIDEDISN